MQSRPTTQAIEVDYDTDDSGMFRAKSRNLYTRGALQIDDSTETKIEIPVDLMEAAEVQVCSILHINQYVFEFLFIAYIVELTIIFVIKFKIELFFKFPGLNNLQ